MNPFDAFRPYSPELRGDLESYLRGCERVDVDNLFYGSEYFFVMRDRGFLMPLMSIVRVNQSPAPDTGYVVNNDMLLESAGQGEHNMSFMGAPKGVYDPQVALDGNTWSITGLNLPEE